MNDDSYKLIDVIFGLTAKEGQELCLEFSYPCSHLKRPAYNGEGFMQFY